VLLLLLLAAACAYFAYGPSVLYNYARLGLGYLGFGWCDPYSVPRRDATYRGAESGAEVHWEGEGEFWSKLPCARSSYRVILPTGTDAVTEQCGSTIVTAMFDVGREHWATYARSNANYRTKAATVLALKNPMVIFTSPDMVDDFEATRRAAGLGGRTLLVASDVHCTPTSWLLQPVSKVMCSASYMQRAAYPEVPERQQPWYNLIMYAKAAFVEAAALLPQPSIVRPWVTWLDLGCHGPMCEPSLAGKCLDPAPWADPTRIRIAQTQPVPPGRISDGPVEFYKAHHIHFAGTIFGTGRDNARHLATTFRDSLMWLLGQGVVCYDQTVFFWAWARVPEAFEVVFVYFDEWAEIVTGYAGGGHPGVGEKLAEDEAHRQAGAARRQATASSTT